MKRMAQDYKTYHAHQLAQDQLFINWVRDGARQSAEPWRSLIEQDPQFAVTVADGVSLVKSMQFAGSAVDTDIEALWNRIDKSTRTSSKPHIRGRRKWLVAATTAAACIALFFIFSPGLSGVETVKTERGFTTSLSLPDASVVTMNAGSRLRFDPDRWETARKLRLEGEAFFSVTKGSTFTVITDNANVEVLGTKFNVYARHETFEVECTEGRVQVTLADSDESQVITSGEMLTIENGRLFKRPMSATEIEWLDETYVFDGAPLARVFGELERQFDIKIHRNHNIDVQRYTGSFEKGELDRALYDVCWPMKLTYQIKGRQVFIAEETPN